MLSNVAVRIAGLGTQDIISTSFFEDVPREIGSFCIFKRELIALLVVVGHFWPLDLEHLHLCRACLPGGLDSWISLTGLIWQRRDQNEFLLSQQKIIAN